MKQTAVEWLEKEIFRSYKFLLQKVDCTRLEELIKQAKEMEKQQIKSAYGAGIETMRKCFSVSSHIPKGSEDFYNETYNK